MTTTTTPIPEPLTDEALDKSETNRRQAVQALLDHTIDARDGLDTALNRAEPEVEKIIRSLRETHHQQGERISAVLVALGGEPDTDGTLRSTINKAAVSLRAMFDEIDDDALEQIADAEGHVLDAFDDALSALRDTHHHDELLAMKDELHKLVAEARKQAD